MNHERFHRALLCAVTLLALASKQASGTAPIAADAPDRDAAVSAGHKALKARGEIPWYDASKDTLRPVYVPPPPPYDFGWLFKPVFWLIVALAGVILALIVWWTTWALLQRQRRAQRPAPQAEPSVVTEGLEALGFLEDRPRNDLLGHARRHYEAGNYAEAIIYLFSYELVELDRNALVRLARGKTNRQYVRETSHARPLAGVLERTMHAFERVFFGGQSLDRGAFEACWNELDDFQLQIAAARGTS